MSQYTEQKIVNHKNNNKCVIISSELYKYILFMYKKFVSAIEFCVVKSY